MEQGNSSSKISPLSVAKEARRWSVSASDGALHFGTSGASVAIATGITHPFDVVKVRLQMQLVGKKGPTAGLGNLSLQIMKNEGVKSLYLGLTPALIRSVLYGGLRLGLYEPSKNFCELAFGSVNIFYKIASGTFSGAIATVLTNPIEVLKVRLQMNTNSNRRSSVSEMRKILSEEGVRSFWKGVGPAMVRAGSLTASQIATYDESKLVLMRCTPLEEGLPLHLVCSTLAGIMSTIVTAPMDMVKTRLMLQRESKQAGSYKHGFHCAYQVVRTEGPRSLYKGGLAIFARLGPQTAITFTVMEKLRKLSGLDAI